jgi:phage terminase small subunit
MRRFVTEYLVDLNATQAAIRAGYSANGASVTGCRLLADPKIRTLIEARNEKRAERVGLTADGVLEGIKRLSEKAENSGDLNVAMKGHELYGKHLKLFTDKVQHEGTVNIAVINPYAKTKGEDR